MSNSDTEATHGSTSREETPSQVLSWTDLVLTPEKIDELWERIQQFPQVFDDFSKGRKEAFVQKLLDPRNVFIDIGDGTGLAAGFNVKPRLDAVLHLVMFDRRLRGREGTFLEIMAHFFRCLQLRRMTVMVTNDSPMTMRLALRLGFKEEGVMRKAILRGGAYLDVHFYGLLKEELDAKIASFSAGPAPHESVAPGAAFVPLGNDPGEQTGV